MTVKNLGRYALMIGALFVGTVTMSSSIAAQPRVDGPRVAPAGISHVVAARQLELPALVLPQDVLRRNRGTDVAMMIAGGAAVVLGAVVGGDGGGIISVAGAVVGLTGLFRYLR